MCKCINIFLNYNYLEQFFYRVSFWCEKVADLHKSLEICGLEIKLFAQKIFKTPTNINFYNDFPTMKKIVVIMCAALLCCGAATAQKKRTAAKAKPAAAQQSTLSNAEEGKNYYTLSMGLSEFISEFDYISEIDLKEINNSEFDYIDTAINFNENLKIDFESEKEYFKDTMPNEMDVNRVVTEYAKVLFETNGKPIKCNTHYYLGSGGEKIVFL